MTFSPGALASTASAISAVAKSPGTNSPVSSTKKHRSASPSYATPRSAASFGHLRDDELAVLGKERVGLVVREAPVRLEVAADDVELGKCSRTGGSITPAMPFAASTTTRRGLIAATSTKESTFAT